MAHHKTRTESYQHKIIYKYTQIKPAISLVFAYNFRLKSCSLGSLSYPDSIAANKDQFGSYYYFIIRGYYDFNCPSYA